MADVGLPHAAMREQVADAFDLVVCQARAADGTRRVVAVAEVVRVAGGAGGARDLRLARRPRALARRRWATRSPRGWRPREAARRPRREPGGVPPGPRAACAGPCAGGGARDARCSPPAPRAPACSACGRRSRRRAGAGRRGSLGARCPWRAGPRGPRADGARAAAARAARAPPRCWPAAGCSAGRSPRCSPRSPGRRCARRARARARRAALARGARPRRARRARGRWPTRSSAGHAVRGAIAAAGARGVPGAAGRELRAPPRALALGEPTEARARAAAAARARARPGTRSSPAILLQRDAGGDLPALLRDLAGALEAADARERDARAATAQARFTALARRSALPVGAAAARRARAARLPGRPAAPTRVRACSSASPSSCQVVGLRSPSAGSRGVEGA